MFYRFECTVKSNSFSLPSHPEAISVYDSKSADEAKIANCSPETIERFRSWGRMDGANKHLSAQQMAKPMGWKRNGQVALLGTPVEAHIMRDGLVAHAPDMYLRARGQHLRVPKLRPEPTGQASPAATGELAASSGGPAEPTTPPGGFAPAESTVTFARSANLPPNHRENVHLRIALWRSVVRSAVVRPHDAILPPETSYQRRSNSARLKN